MRATRLKNVDTLPLGLDLGPVDAVRDLERHYAPSDMLLEEMYGYDPGNDVPVNITLAAVTRAAGELLGHLSAGDGDGALFVDPEALSSVNNTALKQGLYGLQATDDRLKCVHGVVFSDFEFTQFPRDDQLVANRVARTIMKAQPQNQAPIVAWGKQYRAEMHTFVGYEKNIRRLVAKYETQEDALRLICVGADKRGNRWPAFGKNYINKQRRIADNAIQEAVAVSLISHGYTDEERLLVHRAVGSLLYRQEASEVRMRWWRDLSKMTLQYTEKKHAIVAAAYSDTQRRLSAYVTGLPPSIDQVL